MKADDQVENVTDEQVAAAAAEAQEAANLVAQLEEAVAEGDETVTPEQIATQESLSRFARLRAEATRRKAERARAAARLADCERLRAEVDEYAQDDGHRFSGLLTAVHDAEVAFRAAIEERNAKVEAWRQRAERLGVAVSDGTPIPGSGDAGLALGQGDTSLHAGARRLSRSVTSKNYLERLHADPTSLDVLRDGLAQIDAPATASTAAHFYRGTGGSVIARDEPFADEEVRRLRLVKLTREEAWGR